MVQSSLLLALLITSIEAFTFHHSRLKSHYITPLASQTPENNEEEAEEDPFASNAKTISEAVSSLYESTIVVKYGGNAMTSPTLARKFCENVATLQNLGVRVVVVHGGGPQIKSMLERVGVESRFEGGMRVSSKEVVEVAEMVLCGDVNKDIAGNICKAGGQAVGLSGRDCDLMRCTKLVDEKNGNDLGFVGQVESVNTQFIRSLLRQDITPVIAPIGTGVVGDDDSVYNVNADVAAGRIAGELRADRVIFLTDIAGVLDKDMNLIKSLSVKDVKKLINDGTISGGMIPKVSYATSAIELGVNNAFITDGRVPNALLKEVLGGGKDGMGTGEGGTVITL